MSPAAHIARPAAATNSCRAAWDTFAPNRPDVELRGKPGVCSHVVVDGRGRIHASASRA